VAGAAKLSDESTITRWAHVATQAAVRSAPRRGARTIAHLRYWTEHGHPEVYLALEDRQVGAKRWIRVRVPGRPNGRTGWVPASALGKLHTVRTRLVVNRRTAHATLYRRGKAIWRAPVGVGAPGTPTPAGRFWVREKLRGSGGIYGPWALGTAAYSVLSEWPKGGVIAIHGTNQPGLLPGRPSHGCIRVRNGDITRLVKLLPVGTPLRIR
jgi:lipoprotein-anchoring transpeptidase ErfK/SrfK